MKTNERMVTNMSENKNGSFSYTYSPERQEEVRKIQEKYMEKGEDKLARLRSLDASTTKTAQVVALSIGICSTLVMGGSRSLVRATSVPMSTRRRRSFPVFC